MFFSANRVRNVFALESLRVRVFTGELEIRQRDPYPKGLFNSYISNKDDVFDFILFNNEI